MYRSVAIVGYGVEGASAYRYFKDKAEQVTICDMRDDVEIPVEVISQLGNKELQDQDSFDLIVRSPGIRPDVFTDASRLTSVTREFFAQCPAPIIGVTGTKGKGTTSTLIAKMLEASGKRVHLGGNIGVPALDLLADIKDDEYVVLELSSFQLWDLEQSPHIAVVLMIEPDHLDVHTDIEEYIAAKANITRWQTDEDIIVHHPGNPRTLQAVAQSKAQKQPYQVAEYAHVADGEIRIGDIALVRVDEVKLAGSHNLDNICAAVTAVWNIEQDKEAVHSVISSFSGLPHRLELVGEKDGVRFYDDSISTVPSTAIAAIQAFPGPKSIILGGSDKGLEYDELASALKNSEAHAVLIGQTAEALSQAFERVGFEAFETAESLEEATQKAYQVVRGGGIVLLSPACASFDMFTSYADRGDQFQALVKNML